MDLPTSQSSVLSMMALNSKFESQLKSLHSNLSSSIYTKDEIDEKISGLPTSDNVYTKTVVDKKLASKAEISYVNNELDSRPSFNIRHLKNSITSLTDVSSKNLVFSIWESGNKFDCQYLYVTCSFLFKIKSKSLDPMKNNAFLIDQYPNVVNAGSSPYVTVVAGQQISETEGDSGKIYEYNAYANFQGLIKIGYTSDENFKLYFRIVDSEDALGTSHFDITEIPAQEIDILLTYREINEIIETDSSS